MGQAALKLEAPAELISISEMAKRLKLDRATVRSRLEDLGYEPDPTSTPKLQLYTWDAEVEFELKAAKDTVSAMKIRDLRVTAQLKEQKLAKERGELVPMAEAIDLVQAIVKKVYQELTMRQPTRLGGKLAKAKNIMAVKKILKTDNDRIMQSLSENFERFIQ